MMFLDGIFYFEIPSDFFAIFYRRLMENLVFRPFYARFFTDGGGIFGNTVGYCTYSHQTAAGV
jgi:hypothetical protein